MLCSPIYRIMGLERRKDLILGSCVFSIILDLDFAKRARSIRVEHDFQRKFKNIVRQMVDFDRARVDFLDDTAFLRSFSVEGNCACMGVSGDVIDCNWDRISRMVYHGHNIDSKHQAYDLLTIFTYWVDTIEALFFSEDRTSEMKKV